MSSFSEQNNSSGRGHVHVVLPLSLCHARGVLDVTGDPIGLNLDTVRERDVPAVLVVEAVGAVLGAKAPFRRRI